MKKKLLMCCFAASMVLGVKAQVMVTGSNVPASIQSSFKGQYPTASTSNWRMKDDLYRVNFNNGDLKQMASYDASGKLVSTGSSIRETELPAAIGSSIKTSYSGRTIDEIYKIEKNGTPGYWITLKGSPEMKMMYDSTGKVIQDKTNW